MAKKIKESDDPDFDAPSSGDAADLNCQFRNGGRIVENREGYGRDLLGDMALASRRHDILANDLLNMGVVPDGDDPED